MGNDGFDDDFYKIFKKYKLDSMDELNLREEVQNYIKKRFVSKDKIRAKIQKLENTKYYKELLINDHHMTENERIVFWQVDILEELLEEK